MNKMKNEKSMRMMALMLIGLMVFSTVGVFAEQDNLNSDENKHLVKVGLMSGIQLAEMNEDGLGVASYKIMITDNHIASSVSAQDTFKYVLSFESPNEGVVGKFIESDTIELGRMESGTFELEVSTKDLGVSGFVVKVQGEDTTAHSKGKIIFSKRLKPIFLTHNNGSGVAIFNGKGIASQEDNQQSVYLKLLREKDNDLFGKIRIDEKDFRVSGKVVGDKVSFDLFNIRSTSASATDSKVASFEGIKEKYEGSILIKGQLVGFEGEDWDLALMPKNIGKITNAELGVKKKYSAEFQDSISVLDKTSADADEKVYFNLVKVKPKKFLWIFPTKKKLIELEVIRGNDVFTKKITENSEEIIEGYSVSVGDLSDEDNIEFNIEDSA
jgi:hypothetical protein